MLLNLSMIYIVCVYGVRNSKIALQGCKNCRNNMTASAWIENEIRLHTLCTLYMYMYLTICLLHLVVA